MSHLGCPHQVLPLLLNHTSQHYKNILCRIHQHSVPEHKATGNGRTASGTLTKANRKKRCRYSQQKTFRSACQTVAENSLKTESQKEGSKTGACRQRKQNKGNTSLQGSITPERDSATSASQKSPPLVKMTAQKRSGKLHTHLFGGEESRGQ